MRIIGKNHKKIIAVLICICFMAAGLTKLFASESIAAAAGTKTRGEYGRAIASYTPGADGIWRRTNTSFLSEYVEFLRKMSLYSPQISRLDSGSIRLDESVSFGTGFNPFSTETQKKVKTAECMFTGDLMCLKGQQFAAGVKSSYDFWPSYKYVAKVFEKADFVCGNLETLLSESNPITKNQVNAKNGQPQCNGPRIYLDAIREAGFDMLVTANNHTCDWGAVGITETKKHLEEYGFANTGTHYYDAPADGPEDRFVIFDVNGINIAILSYTHIINQRGYLTADQMEKMVHTFDRDKAKEDIKAAKDKGADFVVVYCHWGIENTETLNSAQLNDSKFLAESGADLIIGSHPHCLQKCEYLDTKDGRKVLCMYSMGNFCSSMVRDINNDTIILKVTIEKRAEQTGSTTSMTDASYIPCHVMTKDNHSFVVVPVSEKLNGGYTSTVLDSAKKRIDKIMNGVIPGSD
jgi:poly-gamma-glutamate synthesis protein (capsule biosynthesis protein)